MTTAAPWHTWNTLGDVLSQEKNRTVLPCGACTEIQNSTSQMFSPETLRICMPSDIDIGPAVPKPLGFENFTPGVRRTVARTDQRTDERRLNNAKIIQTNTLKFIYTATWQLHIQLNNWRRSIPAPQTFVKTSSAFVSSSDVNSSSFRSSPLSTISQIFCARRRPIPGRQLASWQQLELCNLYKCFTSIMLNTHV